jgi:hypothetical protein
MPFPCGGCSGEEEEEEEEEEEAARGRGRGRRQSKPGGGASESGSGRTARGWLEGTIMGFKPQLRPTCALCNWAGPFVLLG